MLITGAGGSLGPTVCKLFAGAGARLALAGREAAKLNDTAPPDPAAAKPRTGSAPAEIAAALLWLCSDEAAATNGAPVPVFGRGQAAELRLPDKLRRPVRPAKIKSAPASIILPRKETLIMTLPRFAFFGGRIVPYSEAKVGVLTHALNYGTAAFGGLRGYWNSDEAQLFIFRPYDHFHRFLNSTRLLCMELPYSIDDLITGLLNLLRAEDYREDCYIRPLAFYSDEIIGVRLHNLTPQVSMVSIPFGKYVENDQGAHVTVSSWRRVDDNSIPARGKISGSYVNSAFIKTDAQRAGFDEAIVLNQDGHISEGSAENFFMIRNGKVVTPPITDNILEGITRSTVMTLLHNELGLEIEARPIDRTELYLAEEAFFSGTGVQLAAITRIDHRPVGDGRMGPVMSELRDLFFNVVRGKVPKYRHWCTPVYETERELTRA